MNAGFTVVVTRRHYIAVATSIVVRHVLSLVIFLFGAIPAFMANHNLGRPLWISVLAGVIVGGMFLAILLALNAIWIAVAASRWLGVLGEHHYEITEEGLIHRSAAGNALIKWSALKSVVVFRSAFVIHQTSWLIYIIPRDTHSGALSFEDARTEIRKQIEQALKRT